MSRSDSVIGINDIEGMELPEYRPLCISAMVGLALGVLSFLALLHPVMWFWPLVATGVCVFALFRLSQSDRLVGRAAALCGLFLSLTFLAAAPLRTYTYQWLQKRDARRVGEEWLQAVLEGNSYKVHQWSVMPADRKAMDDTLPAAYAASSQLRTEMDNYLKTPAIARLRALGPRASIDHYQTESAMTDGRNDRVEDVYQVFYDDAGQAKSYFLKLTLWRNLQQEAGPRLWRVQSPEGDYTPKG